MYRELLPRPGVPANIACFWVQTVGDEPYEHRVVPDACADILSVADGEPFLVGPASRAVVVPLPARALIVGVRFKPGRIGSALGVPAHELLDRTLPLADVWERAFSERLWNELGASSDAPRKLHTFEHLVTTRRALTRGVSPQVAHGVAWLARHPDRQVSELASQLGLSTRQLLRQFRVDAGYAPKLLQRILRFQRLLVASSRRERTRSSLAWLAAEAGYADQAHMSREVQELSGVTPRELLRRSFTPDAMSDFFNTARAPRGKHGLRSES